MANLKQEIEARKSAGENKRFEMPKCEFCYDKCGDCMYYDTENFSGWCGYHKKNISSSDVACPQYA